MVSFMYVITDEMGIHARPAGLLVKEVKKYNSAVSLQCEGKTADAKRIIAIMGLGIKKGQEIKITIEGADEEDAAAALKAFLQASL